jgi:beta-propeller repeat-containing protein
MRKLSTTVFMFLLIGALSSASAEVIELRYSTYLGTEFEEGDYGPAVAIDSFGSAYLTGSTESFFTFPTVNPYQSSGSGTHNPLAFVTKFSSSGFTLQYSTYLGGSNYSAGLDLAVDSQGRAWVVGFTAATDFPVKNAYQEENAGVPDGFITRFSASGSTLDFSTYLGGNGTQDWIEAIALDENNQAYLTGRTNSDNFPTFNSYQASRGGTGTDWDAFITKFSSSGSYLIYSTYLGGAGGERGRAIIVSSAGDAYLTGYTSSSNFPTLSAYQASRAGVSADAFLTGFASSGSTLEFSTYLGGSGEDGGQGIDLLSDAGFTVIGLTGDTKSTDFPTLSPYQSTSAGSGIDAFVTLFYAWGWPYASTYLGGAGGESSGLDIAFGESGDIWLTGQTSSPFFPTVNPYQARHGGGTDAFISRFSPGLSVLRYSSFLGGTSADEGRGIAYGGGSIFITGVTSSISFPTRNAFQSSRAGSISNNDIFLSKFSPANSWGYDYNGDGTSDIAIFRGGAGLWAIRNLTRVYFGRNGDLPAPGDYDGSGTTEIALFRPSSGLWAIRGVSRIYFGSSGDSPFPGDYAGNGSWEPAIFRENSGLWAVRGVTRIYFGQFGDTPIPGFYSGSRPREIALFRGTSGLWAIRDISRFYYGAYPDEPVPGNYGGGESWRGAIFRPQSGLWAIRGLTRVYFGQSLDGAYPADYRGDGTDGIAIFRPSSGLWAIRGLTQVYFGQYGDTPVTR